MRRPRIRRDLCPTVLLALLAALSTGCGAEPEPVVEESPAVAQAAPDTVREWMPVGAAAYEASRADQRAAMLLFAADW